MTNEERLKFAEICSRESYLGGCDDASRLAQALAYANQKRNARLYRYRPVNMYSLEGLLFGNQIIPLMKRIASNAEKQLFDPIMVS